MNNEEKELFSQYQVRNHYSELLADDRMVLFAYKTKEVQVTRIVKVSADDTDILDERIVVF